MKFAFSTLGCPEWSWDDMVSTAKDLGFDGIEVRGIEKELYVPKAKPFLSANIEATKARLAKLNLEIPCITSACYLFEKSKIDHYIDEGKQYIDSAQTIGAPYIRVLGDRNPEVGEEVDIGFVIENLSVLADYAKNKNVKVLIETNGVFAQSEVVLKAVQSTKSPNVRILWDIHHPFRYFGEPVNETFSALKQYIEYVHIKDSIMVEDKVKYKMMGYGDIPCSDALTTLKENGYNGYVSLEWVKRWNMELEEPGVVFSHFINFAKDTVR